MKTAASRYKTSLQELVRILFEGITKKMKNFEVTGIRADMKETTITIRAMRKNLMEIAYSFGFLMIKEILEVA